MGSLIGKEMEAYESLLVLIEKNNLMIEIEKGAFPIRVKIKNDFDKDQLSMLNEDEIPNDGYIEFIFEDELIMQVQDFKIEDDLLSKIKSKLKKWHYAYLEMYFEAITTRGNRNE